MKLETISKSQLAQEWALVGADGEVNRRAIATFLRAALARWGLSPKRAVLKHARDQLRAAGVAAEDQVPSVLDGLKDLCECAEVFVRDEPYLAPSEPRWLRTGTNAAAFLGVAGPPEDVEIIRSGEAGDLVQRIRVGSEEDAAALEVAGAREVSISEWLTPLGYMRHADRRAGRPVRSDHMPISAYWDALCDELSRDGLPLAEDADVRAMTGPPGGFFGRRDTPEPEGRWSTEIPDGVWCATCRGYSDAHWHPILVSVDGGARRALDLFDEDEWRWAFLARGRSVGPAKIIEREDHEWRVTFPLPRQLRAAADLVGVRSGSWTWTVPPGATDVWASV